MKRNQQHVITVAVATALASLAAGSACALEVYNDKGWKLDISGSVNAFYTSHKSDNSERAASIENGLLPGYLKVTAMTNQKGWDVKGVVGYWPGIDSNPGSAAKSTADFRTTYLSFGNGSVGTFKLGRDIGLFQSNAILNDMTLIGVGGGAGLARNINTTLGGIGAGYIYSEFQPQITYTSPSLGGLTLNVGMFDNKDVDAVSGNTGKNNGFQGLAEYGFDSGKVWAGFVQQKFTLTRQATATGFELGGKVDIGNFGLMAQGFDGKGSGDTILFAGGFNGNEKRKSTGHLVQATYKIGDLKLGASVGESRTKRASNEPSGDFNRVQGTTLGAYYSLTSNLTLVGELNKRKNKVTDIDTNTVSAGAILFF